MVPSNVLHKKSINKHNKHVWQISTKYSCEFHFPTSKHIPVVLSHALHKKSVHKNNMHIWKTSTKYSCEFHYPTSKHIPVVLCATGEGLSHISGMHQSHKIKYQKQGKP